MGVSVADYKHETSTFSRGKGWSGAKEADLGFLSTQVEFLPCPKYKCAPWNSLLV